MLREREALTSPYVCTHRSSEDTCYRDSTLVAAHEADIGSSLLCNGDSFQEQCTRSNIQNWGHFVPASWRTNSNQMNFMQNDAETNFCPCDKLFFLFRKNGQVALRKLSLHLVPAWCPLVRADLKTHQVRGSMLSPSTYSPHMHPVPPITNSFCLSVPVKSVGSHE